MWQEFATWCRARGLRPLPAHPWTLAAYARWCEKKHRAGTIIERVRSIARVHLLACVPSPDRDPIVGRTLTQLSLRERTRTQRAALFEADPEAEEQVALVPITVTTAVAVEEEEPVEAAAAAAETPRRTRAMRSTPRLVARRPKRG